MYRIIIFKCSFSIEKLSGYPKLLKTVYCVIHIFKPHFASTRATNLIYWVAEISFTHLEIINFNCIEILFSE